MKWNENTMHAKAAYFGFDGLLINDGLLGLLLPSTLTLLLLSAMLNRRVGEVQFALCNLVAALRRITPAAFPTPSTAS